MKKNSKLVLGILGAVTAGVALGMLLAPEKGKDLRKSIKKTTEKWTDEMSNLLVTAKDKLTKTDLKTKAKVMEDQLS